MNDDLSTVYYPLSVLDELREQRILDNDDLARAYDMGRDKERAAVLALLDCELEIAEVHDLLVGTVRLRQLRDIIERGEHRREEKP